MSSKRSSHQIKLGAIISYISIAANIVLGLLYTPWMLRELGKSDYGLYTLSIAFIGYFLVDFGIGNSISRFISKYLVEKRQDSINNFLGLVYKLYFVISILIAATLILLYFLLSDIFVKLSAVEIARFRTIYIITGFYSVISFPFLSLNGILIAYEEFFWLKFVDLLNRILTVTLIIIALLVGQGLYALVLINAFVGLLGIVAKILLVRKNTDIKVNLRFYDKELLKEVFSFSIWMAVIGVAQQLLINITPMILGIVSGTTAIAIFAIGRTIQSYLWTFSNSLNGLFMPRIARYDTEENSVEKTNDLMVRVGRIQLMLVGMMIIGFISLGQDFIFLWVGNAYKDAYWVAVLLIAPSIITLTQEIGYTKLYVIGEVKYRAILFLLASILSAGISVAISPSFGAVGASVAIFIGLMMCHVIGMHFVYSRIAKLNMRKFYKECHLKLLVPLTLSALFGFLVKIELPLNGWHGFTIKGLLFLSVYGVLMWMLGMNYFEKKMILSRILK